MRQARRSRKTLQTDAPEICSSSSSREQMRNPLMAKNTLTPLGPVRRYEYQGDPRRKLAVP